MSKIKKFSDIVDENKSLEDKSYSDVLREALMNEQVMDINTFSQAFIDLYDFIDKYAKNMDSDTLKHLKEAVNHLDKAWENECDAHGVGFEPYHFGRFRA